MIALLLSVLPENSEAEQTPVSDKTSEEPEKEKVPLKDLLSPEMPSVEENGAIKNDKAAEAEAEATKGDSAIEVEPGEAEAEAAPEQNEESKESEEYTRTRVGLEENGFEEYSSDNFKLFGKPEYEPYLLVTEGESVEELGVEEMEITDEFADYFTTYNGKSIVFRFIIATKELIILDPKPEAV